MRPDVQPVHDDTLVTGSLQLVKYLGEGVLGDYKGARTVSVNGVLAVAEDANCRITAIDIESGQHRFSVGECGSGPTNYRRIYTMFYVRDTLYVVDGGLRAVTRLAANGDVYDRRSLGEVFGETGLDPTTITMLDDSTFVGVDYRGADRSAALISVVDLRTKKVLASFQHHVPAVQQHDQAFPYAPMICAAVWRGTQAILATGFYEFEAVAYTRAGEVLWRSHSPKAWAGPARNAERIVPRSLLRRPICSPLGVMLRMSRTSAFAPVNEPLAPGDVEIRSPAGKLLFRDTSPADDDTWLAPGTAWGDFWLFSDPESPRPRYRVYRLASANGSETTL